MLTRTHARTHADADTHPRTAWHRTTPHGTTPHGTARHGTARHRTAPHCTALHCTAARYRTAPHGIVPHRQVCCYPRGNGVDDLSLYLAVADADTLPVPQPQARHRRRHAAPRAQRHRRRHAAHLARNGIGDDTPCRRACRYRQRHRRGVRPVLRCFCQRAFQWCTAQSSVRPISGDLNFAGLSPVDLRSVDPA